MTIAGILITQRLDLPSAARLIYPGNISLQRKWIKAFLEAPGPCCRIGTL